MMSFWLAEAPSETADIYALYQDPRYEKMGMRALVRLDRAAKALAEGAALEANGVAVTLSCPPWASYSLETEAS